MLYEASKFPPAVCDPIRSMGQRCSGHNMIIPQQCKPGVCGITLNVYTRTSTISLMGIYNLLGHSQSLSLEQSSDISVF